MKTIKHTQNRMRVTWDTIVDVLGTGKLTDVWATGVSLHVQWVDRRRKRGIKVGKAGESEMAVWEETTHIGSLLIDDFLNALAEHAGRALPVEGTPDVTVDHAHQTVLLGWPPKK